VTPRILVIRGGAIGDFVLTLPSIRLLRENFPEARVEIVGCKHIVALAERRYYAAATRSIEYAGLSSFFSPGSDLDPELVSYFTGFQQVISYLFDPDGLFDLNLRRAGVKNLIHGSPRMSGGVHAAKQLALPLQNLGLYLDDPAARLHPSEADRQAAGIFLENTPRPLVAIHPGSGGKKKKWELDRWERLGNRLLETRSSPTLLIVGGEADGRELDHLRSAWAGRAVRFAESFALPDLAAILEQCDHFIGHDSGISHIAAAVGIRCTLLFGPTDPEVWAPKNPGVRVVEAPRNDLSRLPVETVFEAAFDDYLNSSPARVAARFR
jgi:heptosyltransferase-3